MMMSKTGRTKAEMLETAKSRSEYRRLEIQIPDDKSSKKEEGKPKEEPATPLK